MVLLFVPCNDQYRGFFYLKAITIPIHIVSSLKQLFYVVSTILYYIKSEDSRPNSASLVRKPVTQDKTFPKSNRTEHQPG